MSVSVVCPQPNCRKPLQLADASRGGAVRCPHCQQVFRVSGATAVEGNAPAATLPLSDVPSATMDDHARPTAGAVSVPSQTVASDRIGRFQVRQRLGEGAFGVVYRAHDPQLDREVALKVAKAATLSTKKRVDRFLREAKAAAQLRHPYIVPLFDAGKDGERYYIATAFIGGGTLEAVLEQQRFDFRRTVEVVRALAEALAYAHSLGIVHRDVKPANVMLDEKGQPLLMDFGLAARQEEAEKLTQDGTILGTPLYMAPEQARGKTGVVLPASDQYSLGVVLYEMLTGETPFHGTPEVVIVNHLTVEPKSPRKLNRKVPRDLETICLKCLEKEPQRRYVSCQALADDLRRWLEGEAIAARRLSRTERLWRWVKKEPRLAAALSFAAVTLLTLVVQFAQSAHQEAQNAEAQAALTKQARQDAFERGEALKEKGKALRDIEQALKDKEKALADLGAETKARDEAQKAKEEEYTRAEWLLYASNIERAQHYWNEGNIPAAWNMLDACNGKYRGWEYDYLHTLFNQNQSTLRGNPPYGVSGAVFSADGQHIACAGGDGMVKVWDVNSGQERMSLNAPGDRFNGSPVPLLSVAFSPEGKRLVAGYGFTNVYGTGKMKVWEVASGKEVLSLKGDGMAGIRSVAFSADGQRIVSGSGAGKVQVWDVRTGQETLSIKASDWLSCVAFSPDSSRIACGDGRRVRLFDAGTKQETLTLIGFNGDVSSVAYSPDGKRIVGSSFLGNLGEVRMWDADSGKEAFPAKTFPVGVSSVAFSPDSKRFVSGGSDQRVKVWDTASGQEVLSLKGHSGRVNSVAFSPDGKRIVSSSDDQTVKVWDAGSARRP